MTKVLKLWGSIIMQGEHLGFWSFPILFQVLHQIGNNLSTLNQAFIKSIWENQVLKLFLWSLETKHFQQVQLQWTLRKCQGHRADQWSNQKLFNHCQHTKIIRSIYSIYEIIYEIFHLIQSPLMQKVLPIFEHAHPIILHPNRTQKQLNIFSSDCKNVVTLFDVYLHAINQLHL